MNSKPYLLYMNENPSLMSKVVNKFRMKMDLTDIKRIRALTEEKLKVVVPEGIKVEEVSTSSFKGLFLNPRGARGYECILYLHGGGYSCCGGVYMKMNGIKFAEAFGVRTFALDYRLAPEHKFPAALEDAVNAYEYLLSQGYESRRIIIMGESAGGGLAFALVHRLKQMEIDIPGAIVAISPWTDLHAHGESHILNRDKDIVFKANLDRKDPVGYATIYADEDEFSNPLVSPLYGDFHGFPPSLIIVGENEILLSDSVNLAERAYEHGVRVELQIWHQMFHAFPVFPPFDKTLPEAKRAMRYITHFVDRHLCSQSPGGC